jgi:hypothetical protein
MGWATLNASANRVAFDRLGSVSANAGAVSARGFLVMPGQVIADGMVVSTDYTLTALADDFGGLLYGDAITVDGINYSVRTSRRIDDGTFVELLLSKLAPDVAAPGSNPADYSLKLADLADVDADNSQAGDVLINDGTNWVDGDVPPSWIELVTQFSSVTLTGSTAAGSVYAYVQGGVTRYRLVPVPYDAAQDAFYSTFTGGALSGLIVSRG